MLDPDLQDLIRRLYWSAERESGRRVHREPLVDTIRCATAAGEARGIARICSILDIRLEENDHGDHEGNEDVAAAI